MSIDGADWWQEFGANLQFMPDTPALAFDMATGGPTYHPFALSLAYNMQNSPTPLQVYPQDEGSAAPEEG